MRTFLEKAMQPRLIRFWILIGLVIVALLCFEEVVDDVFHDPLEGDFEAQHFDRDLAQIAQGQRTVQRTQVMTDLTALGSVSVISTLFLIFVSLLLSFRDFRGIAFISIVLAGGGLWPTFLKPLFNRQRPPDLEWLGHVSDLSFPSGHSFGSAAAYLGFAYYASLYAKTWTHECFFYLLGILLAATVGVSRIYLGVHFPTDVLAGLAGGVAWSLFAAAAYEYWFRSHARV